jgi:hypothetical protein
MPTVPAQLTNRPGSSSGLLDRTPVGAVVFLPLGGDPSERPFVGGVGTPEMRERFRETTFEVAVRMDDNSMRVIQRFDGSQYRAGDRVRITGQDQLELVLDR